MKPPNLPVFPGWRPLEPDEMITKEASIVCVEPNNPNSRQKLGIPGDGPHRWEGMILGKVWGKGLNPDYWFYVPGKKEYTPRVKPLPLP